MESEDMTHGEDVTIYLVKKSVSDDANREKKRRKHEYGANSGTPLGEVDVDSRKLRQCSKYFEACLSDRWTSDAATESSSRLEFYLEAQTEVLYYEDCFSRMNRQFPKPIPGVRYCIELLKVASQIQYEAAVNAGMQFLAGVSWKDDDETLIRDFCNSGHFVADGASDLKARLDLTTEERLKNRLVITKRSLSQYFEVALSHGCKYQPERRKLFADALDVIVSDLESDMSNNLLEYVMTLVRTEAEKILSSFSRDVGNVEFWDYPLEDRVADFCWLYHMSRTGNASQVLVELILKNEKILREPFRPDYANEEVQMTWVGMMCRIFEDLLAGHLLLNTSERYSLFSNWIWLLQDGYLVDFGEDKHVEFITDIVLTFPLPIQEKIYNDWGDGSDESVLSQSRTAWIMLMVKDMLKSRPKIRALECKHTSADKV